MLGVQNEDLRANNDKLERGRKKMQQEFDDMNVELENSRSNLSALEKKQKKFDQVNWRGLTSWPLTEALCLMCREFCHDACMK